MLRYLIAIVLLIQGIGHLIPFMASWAPRISKTGFSNIPWIFSNGIRIDSPIGQAFGLLGFVALVCFVTSALGLVTRQEWWRRLVIVAAAISIMTIVPWWNTWPQSNLIAALLVDIAFVFALLLLWRNYLSHALQ
jgi:hypothetical protein